MAIQLPLGQEDKHQGVIDLVEMKAYRYLDEALGSEVRDRGDPGRVAGAGPEAPREHDREVAEAADEADDDTLFEKFVGGQMPSVAEIKAAIRKATIAMKLFPVICGSAFKNKGVQPMLDCGGGLPALAARHAADAGERPGHG